MDVTRFVNADVSCVVPPADEPDVTWSTNVKNASSNFRFFIYDVVVTDDDVVVSDVAVVIRLSPHMLIVSCVNDGCGMGDVLIPPSSITSSFFWMFMAHIFARRICSSISGLPVVFSDVCSLVYLSFIDATSRISCARACTYDTYFKIHTYTHTHTHTQMHT